MLTHSELDCIWMSTDFTSVYFDKHLRLLPVVTVCEMLKIW